MSDDQMRDFVEQLEELSEIDPNVLLGNHMRRMRRDRDRAPDTELLEVMYDWWRCSLFEMTQEEAMYVLVRALSNANCKHLANHLRHASTQQKEFKGTKNVDIENNWFKFNHILPRAAFPNKRTE